MLCTPSKTYAVRSVQISNELVLFAPTTVAPSFWEEGAGLATKGLEVRDTLHELLELSECVPRVGRIEHVLKNQAWDGLEEDREEDDGRPVSTDESWLMWSEAYGQQLRAGRARSAGGEGCGPDPARKKEGDDVELDAKLTGTPSLRPVFASTLQRKRTKYTLAHLKSIIQSSDAELVAALHDQNVITVNGSFLFLSPLLLRTSTRPLTHLAFLYHPDRLVPLPPLQLSSFLSFLLRTLVLNSDDNNPPLDIPTVSLLARLREHGVSAEFAEAALARFGAFEGAKGELGRKWAMAEEGREVVREIGRGVLVGKLKVSLSFPLTPDTRSKLTSDLVLVLCLAVAACACLPRIVPGSLGGRRSRRLPTSHLTRQPLCTSSILLPPRPPT